MMNDTLINSRYLGMRVSMASMYWLKLYHEMLDDPKMGMLPDRLYRRVIELLLLAGQVDDDGYLPELKHIAFRLRVSEEHLETDLVELAKVGIVQQVEGRWHVINFTKRQAPVEVNERVRRHRERKRKEQYYASNENETNRYIDTETDTETNTETDVDTEQQQKVVDSLLKKCELSSSRIQKIKAEQSLEDIIEVLEIYEQGKKLGKVNGPGYIVDYFRYGWKHPDWYISDPDSEKARGEFINSWMGVQ